MNAFIKIVFVILFAILLAFVAMSLSRFFIPKGAGLAAGAMVLWYGILGLLLGIIASVLICRKAEQTTINKLTMVLLAINIVMGIYIIIRIRKLNAEKAEYTATLKEPKPVSAPAMQLNNEQQDIGLGIAKVIIRAPHTIKFFGTAEASSMPSDTKALDSLTFVKKAYNIEIATAPPWLVPEHLKMDYQIFFFKVLAQNRNFYQVEVNKTNQKKMWIDKNEVEFLNWPDFLLSCHSVEAIYPQDNLVRIKPMNHAEPMLDVTEQHILKPLQVQAEWIEVEVLDQQYNAIKKGWIRWRNAEGIIIHYNLLS